MLNQEIGQPVSGDSEAPPSVTIDAAVARSFTYASYQNAVPVLRSLAIANPTDRHLEQCRLDIPLAELASLVVAEPALLEETDPALALAHLLGVERLAATSRARLDEALRHASTRLQSVEADGQ